MKHIQISIPVMGSVNTDFFASFVNMQWTQKCHVMIVKDTVIYNARNTMAITALERGYDYVLWLDSDMTFEPDLLERLYQTATEKDLDVLGGLYFKRTVPTIPTILKTLEWRINEKREVENKLDFYTDYPKDTLFEVAGLATGCMLTKADVYRKVIEKYGVGPFQPLISLGEDYSFCWRLQQLGIRMWCDSRIKLGHSGNYIYDEAQFLREQAKDTTSQD